MYPNTYSQKRLDECAKKRALMSFMLEKLKEDTKTEEKKKQKLIDIATANLDDLRKEEVLLVEIAHLEEAMLIADNTANISEQIRERNEIIEEIDKRMRKRGDRE